MFLSFIIPLYNCEKYIANCLDTILGSKLFAKDYEIIIVNDESKDQGPEIVREYEKRYSNIHLLSQENKGASAARNKGLEHAKGEYIWFVDADDSIIPEFLEKVYSILNITNVELLCFNHKREYTDHTDDIIDFKERTSVTGVEFFKGHYSNFIWNKIYKRSALNNNRFLDGTKNIEDMLFNMCTIIYMENILCVPEYGYKYNCTNIKSTSRNLSLRNLVKLDQDSVTVLIALNDLANNQTNEERKAVLKEELNFSLAGHLYSLFRYYSPQRLRKRTEQYRQLGIYPVGKSWNTRGNRFLMLANHARLFVNTMRMCMVIRKYTR